MIKICLQSKLSLEDVQKLKVLADITAMNFNAFVLASNTTIEAQKVGITYNPGNN